MFIQQKDASEKTGIKLLTSDSTVTIIRQVDGEGTEIITTTKQGVSSLTDAFKSNEPTQLFIQGYNGKTVVDLELLFGGNGNPTCFLIFPSKDRCEVDVRQILEVIKKVGLNAIYGIISTTT